jgi:hypothetical protein
VDLLVAARQHGVRGIPETVKHGSGALGIQVDLVVAARQCKVYLRPRGPVGSGAPTWCKRYT